MCNFEATRKSSITSYRIYFSDVLLFWIVFSIIKIINFYLRQSPNPISAIQMEYDAIKVCLDFKVKRFFLVIRYSSRFAKPRRGFYKGLHEQFQLNIFSILKVEPLFDRSHCSHSTNRFQGKPVASKYVHVMGPRKVIAKVKEDRPEV